MTLPSATHVRGHAGTESLAEHPALLPPASLSLRPTLRQISRAGWVRRRFAAYQVYLTNDKKLSPNSIHIVVAALRFLFKVTLKKDWTFEDVLPLPKKQQKPAPSSSVLRKFKQFLERVQSIKHRTILTTCYAAGLRISEVVHLKPNAIDSKRMVIRVEQGKGQERPLRDASRPSCLEILRDWWRAERPQHWLDCPGSRSSECGGIR